MIEVIVKLYTFQELSEEVKQKLIEDYRSNADYTTYSEWVIDDCYLLNPAGEDDLIIGNNRKVYFDLYMKTIDVKEAVVIENEEAFLKWLGIPTDKNNFFWELWEDTICFEPDNCFEDSEDSGFSPEDEEIFQDAKNKFEKHLEKVLENIEESLDYYCSDEFIIEQLENNEDWYTKTGQVFDIDLEEAQVY